MARGYLDGEEQNIATLIVGGDRSNVELTDEEVRYHNVFESAAREYAQWLDVLIKRRDAEHEAKRPRCLACNQVKGDFHHQDCIHAIRVRNAGSGNGLVRAEHCTTAEASTNA